MFKNKAFNEKNTTMDKNFKLWKGNLTSEKTTWNFANRESVLDADVSVRQKHVQQIYM